MNTRDQLAALLREHGTPIPDAGYPGDEYDCCAEEIVAAGWRPPAQVIETAEELSALPAGTVIEDGNGEFHCLDPYGHDNGIWHPAWLVGRHYEQDFGQVPALPATVVSILTEVREVQS